MKIYLFITMLCLATIPAIAEETFNVGIRCYSHKGNKIANLFCDKRDKISFLKEILNCTKTVGFAPNGGEYEDWDTSDYPKNLESCSRAVANAFGCKCLVL